MKKSTAVLGLGNPLMADEGIGSVLVQRLSLLAGHYPGIDFIDAGTSGFKILHLIEARQKVVFLDCAFMDEEPGTIRRFTVDQVESVKTMTHFSMHEGDLLHLLHMAEQLGQCPGQVVIFGIQPAVVEVHQGLSPVLIERLDDYISVIDRELRQGLA
jgi:hydrogenase maturation protease